MNCEDLKEGELYKFHHLPDGKKLYSYVIYLGSESRERSGGYWYEFAIQKTNKIYKFGLSTVENYVETIK